jgi:predicted lactoylglutathione lyase
MAVPPRLSIVTLGVTDVARATEFYESLGWERSPASQPTITFFALQGSVLGLYERSALADDAKVSNEGSGFRGVTCALNCESEEEVDAVWAEWVAKGGDGVLKPHRAFWGGYSSYVADPDGHLWEIAFNPHAAIGDDGRVQI